MPLLPIAVLISGKGRTLGNLIQRIADGQLDAEIRLVVSSDEQAHGLHYAAEASIPSEAIPREAFADAEAYRDAVFGACRRAEVELVVMAGFIKHVPIPSDFVNRVVNIHPALIPSFCGKGFYGRRVHEAALAYGVKLTGCTIHFVDDQYDQGPIILRATVPVKEDDSPDTLADRVFQLECELYPQAFQLIAHRRVTVEGRRVRIDGDRPEP